MDNDDLAYEIAWALYDAGLLYNEPDRKFGPTLPQWTQAEEVIADVLEMHR